jgi:anti-sigma B factor antagonist
MIKLKCLNCGLTLRREGTGGDFCPRCMARENRVVHLITISDRPSSPNRASMGRLTMQTSERAGTHTLALRGELDISSAPMLEAALADVCARAPTEVVIDMAGVEFVDSSGFNAILRAKVLCEEWRCGFSLTPAQRPVERMVEATRLIDRLPFRKAGSAPSAARE